MRRLLVLLLILSGLGLVLAVQQLSLAPTLAQDDEGAQYVGARMCFRCHRDPGASHFESPHVLTLQEPGEDGAAILADFEQGAEVRSVTFPGEDEARPFTAKDVALVLGTGRYMQMYLFSVGEGDATQYMVFPALWNTVDETWQPFAPADEWPSEAYNFNQQCAGCHVTGLAADQSTWIDNGAQCEACHGPGSEHVRTVQNDESTPEDISASIVLSPDSQICGQCHSQGSAPDGHPYPIGYLPGETLVDDSVYALYPPDNADYWWPTGHARRKYMQLNESLYLGHSGTLTDLKASENAADACLACHSEDYRWATRLAAEGEEPTLPTLEAALHGVTCTSCHVIHPQAAAEGEGEETSTASTGTALTIEDPYALCVECHNDTDVTEGIHHPVQEMFEGEALIEGIEGVPSAHFSASGGPTCVTCHMARVPVEVGLRTSHSFQPVLPGLAMGVEGLQDSCSLCHRNQVDQANLQQLIDDIQADTQARIEAARAAINENSPDWVTMALDFVEGDGSRGVHNYTYTDRLLDAVEAELGLE